MLVLLRGGGLARAPRAGRPDRRLARAADAGPQRRRSRRPRHGPPTPARRRRRPPRPSPCRAESRARSLRRRGRGIVSAGDQQLSDAARQQRPIGRVVVAAARDAVGKRRGVTSSLVIDVVAVEEARLAHADLRRDVDHEGSCEARHPRAHLGDRAAIRRGPGNRRSSGLRPRFRRAPSCAGSCTRRCRARASSATSWPICRR